MYIPEIEDKHPFHMGADWLDSSCVALNLLFLLHPEKLENLQYRLSQQANTEKI